MTAPLSTAESVETLTILIELSGTDITADYGDWCNIGFALAHEFGADGECFFHRISAFYPKYDQKAAHNQYVSCLRHRVPSGKAPITIATLFHIAKAHGISLPCPPSKGLAAGQGIHSRGSIEGWGEERPPLRGGAQRAGEYYIPSQAPSKQSLYNHAVSRRKNTQNFLQPPVVSTIAR